MLSSVVLVVFFRVFIGCSSCFGCLFSPVIKKSRHFFPFTPIFSYLCRRNQLLSDMTAVQLNAMNTELWQSIGTIADSEPLMKRLTRYAKKLVKEKNDPTLMTKEEFFAKLDEAEQQIARGEGHTMLPNEDLTTFLRRVGYDFEN